MRSRNDLYVLVLTKLLPERVSSAVPSSWFENWRFAVATDASWGSSRISVSLLEGGRAFAAAFCVAVLESIERRATRNMCWCTNPPSDGFA